MTTETEKHLIALSVAKEAVDAELCAMRLRVKDLEWHVENQRENVTAWCEHANIAEAKVARVEKALEGLCDSCDYTDLRAALEGEQQ
ncbi:hypothetical protein [Rhodococcus erythropolis]|uniref:hypothetical protein n=1 Tax=Rhodococcus erythropolis TaxID=1833 RepID=UPI001BE52783|nr:hypothetical protein [Rhodococcus erythropolis]MBT2266418.1 hypothetical protein [Rhodococcus erythropolis]